MAQIKVFYLAWLESALTYMHVLSAAKAALISNKHNPRFLFETVAKLTQPSVSCSPFMAHDFFDFFLDYEIRYLFRISQTIFTIFTSYAS